MYQDKKILYTVSSLIPAGLLLAWLLPDGGRMLAAILLLPAAILLSLLVRKRSILSYNKGQVLMLIAVISVMFLVLLYLSGLHFGFWKTIYPLSLQNFGRYILPITVIIVASEAIRRILRAQNDRAADVLGYLIGVLSEVLIVSSLTGIRTFNQFMDVMGMTLFPAITANLLYHYLSKRYGLYPNLVYRLATTLYPYFIPVIPAMPDSLLSFIMLLLPLAVWMFIDMLYERKRQFARHRKPIVSYILIGLTMILMLSLVMLISNQFRFRSLVIATESMTGELNKGDAVVFEKYDGQVILVGQIVVFEQHNSLFVHRVVDIKHIDGEMQYFTKGDANDSPDSGYRTVSEIAGTVKFKIPYLGYPTLWMRSLFENIAGGR